MTDYNDKIIHFLRTFQQYPAGTRIDVSDPLAVELITEKNRYPLLTYLDESMYTDAAFLLMVDTVPSQWYSHILSELGTVRKKSLVMQRPQILYPLLQNDPHIVYDRDVIQSFCDSAITLSDFNGLKLHQQKANMDIFGPNLTHVFIQTIMSVSTETLKNVFIKQKLPNTLWNFAPKDMFQKTLITLMNHEVEEWVEKVKILIESLPASFLPPSCKELKEWLKGENFTIAENDILLELLIDTSNIQSFYSYDIQTQEAILRMFLSPFAQECFVPEEIELFV